MPAGAGRSRSMNTAVGRVALVTGGGRGIGLACVTRLLVDGFAVGVVEISEKAIASARAALVSDQGRVAFASGSVTDRGAIERIVDDLVGRWGRLDVLVNNAAVNRA